MRFSPNKVFKSSTWNISAKNTLISFLLFKWEIIYFPNHWLMLFYSFVFINKTISDFLMNIFALNFMIHHFLKKTKFSKTVTQDFNNYIYIYVSTICFICIRRKHWKKSLHSAQHPESARKRPEKAEFSIKTCTNVVFKS